MRFIDLFAGLGGFHIALRELGHECVFASEIDKELIELYKTNYELLPVGDICTIDEKYIPEHDILCAGFPCQPFSKAGKQKGLQDPSGMLFYEIIRVISFHKPKFFLLENVSNLENHNEGRTWAEMSNSLCKLGYDIRTEHISPHEFGIPQLRKRMFIVGKYGAGSLSGFRFPPKELKTNSVNDFLEKEPVNPVYISEEQIKCLEIWQDFIQRYPSDERLISPVWSMEFGATYPYVDRVPVELSDDELGNYKGSFGIDLSTISPSERRSHLPHYALSHGPFPSWKKNHIRNNRELYERYEWIKDWIPSIKPFIHSSQKMEWNCQNADRDIWNKIIRFRSSGVRFKSSDTIPTLNTISTQLPIIGSEKRFITMTECASLYGIADTIKLPKTSQSSIKALGNGVNVQVVRIVAEALLNFKNGINDD